MRDAGLGTTALNGTAPFSSDAQVPRNFLTKLAEMVGRVATTLVPQSIDS